MAVGGELRVGRARRARTRASGWSGQGAHLGGASCEEHGERVDVVARERPRPAICEDARTLRRVAWGPEIMLGVGPYYRLTVYIR